MTYYTMRATARPAEKDVHRWVFAHSMDPEVEFTVRKWLCQRLDGFYCDLQIAYISRCFLVTDAMTHIVLHYPPIPTAHAENNEIVSVDLQGLSSRDAVKALMKATGLNPHLSVCGWPFCLYELGGVDDRERGTI